MRLNRVNIYKRYKHKDGLVKGGISKYKALKIYFYIVKIFLLLSSQLIAHFGSIKKETQDALVND
jgi:hypothetical protein